MCFQMAIFPIIRSVSVSVAVCGVSGQCAGEVARYHSILLTFNPPLHTFSCFSFHLLFFGDDVCFVFLAKYVCVYVFILI